MNAAAKAIWVAALRSGDYEQALGYLCKVDPSTGNEEWCCLGVLFDVAAVDEDARWIPALAGAEGDTVAFWSAGYGADAHSCSGLPPVFRIAVGITEQEQQDLITLNDTRRKTFKEIATWVEVNL